MQGNLFDADEISSGPIRHSIENAELLEYPKLLDNEQATQILETLIAVIPWQQEYLKIAGRIRAVPRLQCWMGDSSSEYGYSGVRLTPCPWHETVQSLHDTIAKKIDVRFNSVLLNYYRNGQDSVAWHADDEPELGDRPLIASLSLGAERSFELKQKHGSRASKYRMPLLNGSLLVMGGGMQQHWLHQLPKDKMLDKPRINLTFRNIVSGS
ncbi:MAG: alpha-ketoglutarate-dependent dioxygenase AlkB [Pseudohongiella sp.]|nr:MAG: alpha-ketoglutarate-dependent dioxygenase AlkB [Pseudohongiella sp.]